MSSAFISESSCSARHIAVRSRSCGRVCLVVDNSVLDLRADFEGEPLSSEVGSLDVGFWKGIDRKRVDSILAVGTKDKM